MTGCQLLTLVKITRALHDSHALLAPLSLPWEEDAQASLLVSGEGQKIWNRAVPAKLPQPNLV